jgi:hypothetical protein
MRLIIDSNGKRGGERAGGMGRGGGGVGRLSIVSWPRQQHLY